MEHCNLVIEKIKKIKSELNASIILDRGYFSQKNVEFLLKNKFDFVCMGKTNKTFNNLITKYNVSEISKTKHWIVDSTYGVKVKDKVFSTSNDNFYIYLFYDSSDVSEIISNKISTYNYYSTMLIGKLDKDGHIRNTYGKILDFEIDENYIITKATINNEAMDAYKESCGYYYLISNEDLEINEVVKIYRYRDIIEKQMKYNKTGCDLNKTYSQSDKVFCSKRFMGFIASIIRTCVILKAKSYMLQYNSETSQTILKELDKIRVEKIAGEYILKNPLTSKQKQLLSLFSLTIEDVKKINKQINECLSL